MTARLSIAMLAAAALSACASLGEYVWVDALLDSGGAPEGEYLIVAGDLLSVRVVGQETMSSKTRVRADGRISLPFIDDQMAAGLTPTMLARFLETDLKTFLVNPRVTVALEEQHVVQVSVLGEVVKPGVYKLDQSQGVLHALALAGGLTQFAGRDRIFVVRKAADRAEGAQRLRIRFSYDALAHASGRAASFRLQDADVLMVE
jgi:polysaccharide export outer membrane protein